MPGPAFLTGPQPERAREVQQGRGAANPALQKEEVHMQKKYLQKKLRQNALYVLFTGPAMLLFFTFVICSVGLGIFYSLRDWNGIDPASNFVGLRNYVRVFSDPDFRASLWFTIRYTAITVVLVNVFALLLAVGLNARIPGRGLLRAAFFTPMVISSVTSGYLWNFIVVHLFPMLGKLTGIEGLQKDWMSYPPLAFAAIIIVSVWQMTGYYMLIYLTGLQGVPQEIVEAATIDGAGPVQTFFRVKLPMIRSSVTICLFLSLVGGFKSFDLNYSLTNGGPFGTTQSLSFQIYLDAFKRDAISYASAKAVLFSILIALVAGLQVLLTRRKEVEL